MDVSCSHSSINIRLNKYKMFVIFHCLFIFLAAVHDWVNIANKNVFAMVTQ